MRLVFAAVLAFAASVSAQSPLSMPFTANNGGSPGWQIFFDLNVLDPSGITLTSLDVNCGSTAVGTNGTIEVYTGPTTHVGNETNAAAWSVAASGGVIAQGNNVPSPACLGAGLFLPPGPHGIAIRHVGVSLRYTNGTGTNQNGATNEVTLAAGSVIAGAFTGTFFTPRVFNGNLHYNVGAVPGAGCAQSATYGAGCYAGTTTFYELFPSLAVCDLGGGAATANVLVATPAGSLGYVVTAGAPAWFTPTGAPVLTNAATPAAMGDNSFSQALNLPFSFAHPAGSTSVLHAASNGYVNLFATTATTSDLSPTTAELLAQDPRLCPLWCDLHPATNLATNPASGVYFDVDPSGQTAYVTWLDVAHRSGGVPVAGATSVNVQVAVHSNGLFEFRYRTLVPNANAGNVIVGWSKGSAGGASLDPGSIDLSVSLPVITTGPDHRPLVHTVGLPRLGTTLTLGAVDADNLVPLAFLFFGDTVVNPGIDLGFLGASGCRAYTNGNLGSATFPLTLPAGTGSFGLPIPANPLLTGVTITSQVFAFTLLNPLNLEASNGATWTLGN